MQIPYLQTAFSDANNILGTQQSTPFYGGQLYAPLNSSQNSAIGGLNNYASGSGNSLASLLSSTGMNAMSGIGNAVANAGTIFNQTQENPTAAIAASAGEYANNPYTQSELNAINTPIQQQLNEQALPSLNAAASGSGNANSSRTGVAQAILQRDAGTQEANADANYLSGLYNSGLNTAAGLYNDNLLGSLSANNTLLNAGTAGANTALSGYNTSMNNLNVPLETGNIQQQNAQNADTTAYNAWNAQQQYPWNSLNNYYNIVGNKSWGGTTNSSSNSQYTSTQQPSLLGDLSSVLGLGNMVSNSGALSSLFGPNTSSVVANGGGGGGYIPVGGGMIGSAVNGIGNTLGGIFSSIFSDPRVKNIGGKTNTKGALDGLMDIPISNAKYKWDAPGTQRPMFMAPDVQKVMPSAVSGATGGSTPQMVHPGVMMPHVIAAIQELNKKVDARK